MLRNSIRSFLLGAAPAGIALALVSAQPASAQFFFDIFNPPQQPQYSAPEGQRVYEHRRPHRRHRVEERHKRRRHEAKRELAWNPKEAKGPFQIVIAIASQQLLLYGQDGLIGRASISTGMPGHPTPTGVFTVLSKARWHESNIYSGAPMPWMQRITWSGIAMHEGPRPGYPASHGCIRLPGDFAVRMYHTTKVGVRVIVTREPVAPEPIASAKLFEPAPPEAKADAKPVTVAANGDAAAHMTFAAKTSSAKPAAKSDASGDDKAASDPSKTGDTKTPAASGDIALPEPAKPAKKPVADDQPKPSGPVAVFVEPQAKQGVRAPGLCRIVRHAGDHRRSGPADRHPCLHRHGAGRRRQGDALDGDVDPEQLSPPAPRRTAASPRPGR